jgi:hypothetical protein
VSGSGSSSGWGWERPIEDARHGARDALLALLAAIAVGAALDHVEGAQDARVGVTVDPQPRRGLERALAAVVDEVRPFFNGLFVKLLHKGALVLGAGLPHEIDGGAVEVLPPRLVSARAGPGASKKPALRHRDKTPMHGHAHRLPTAPLIAGVNWRPCLDDVERLFAPHGRTLAANWPRDAGYGQCRSIPSICF